MKIIINGKTATLKKGTSFEFVSENRSFTGSDSYTLSITFPLRGCPENIAIFGNINRTDIDKSKVVFDCEIQGVNFYRSGIITIVEISEKEVKTQFLEGRSEQNFDDTFDEVYINELDLGSYPQSSLPSNPASQWVGLRSGQEAVALPWVNNSSSSGNIQNEVVYSNGAYSYHADCKGLSYQPYLISIVKRICASLGYSCDVSQWDNRKELQCLLICNTLPWAWDIPQFARALPHWSVTEFFEKLENFLGGEFDINHKLKSITFSFTTNILDLAKPVKLEKVIDAYSTDVTTDDESNYIESVNIRYKECNHHMWKFYSCPWFLHDVKEPIVYDNIGSLIDATKSFARVRNYGRGSNIHRIFYAKDVDTYFIIRCIRNEYVSTNSFGIDIYDRICILQPINMFGDKIVDENNDNAIEIEFVPVCIDETEASKGNCMFLDLSGYEEDNADTTAGSRPNDSEDSASKIYQPNAMQRLQNGEQTEKAEYYDKIYVGFWDGNNYYTGKLPRPHLDTFGIREDWSVFYSFGSLRLKQNQSKYSINPKQKFHFSFISDTIPNVRSLFYINGKKYLCEKITATFTENGMSQLLKGNFYLVHD